MSRTLKCRPLWLVALALLVPGAGLLLLTVGVESYSSRIDRIEPGMTAQEVKAVLGRPADLLRLNAILPGHGAIWTKPLALGAEERAGVWFDERGRAPYKGYEFVGPRVLGRLRRQLGL